ncbi:MAG: bis(5'-nucleosyl)-tetraphosphatase (symmetrical) YqeK [Oscillospiraceae bacterium]|nr:bis(5'-nucleosyl)-tetraphosphatase (symmetrical) YqeK [Oscillospiraceae bacterium]
MTIREADALARRRLSDRRYYHTQCVAKAARELAPKFGADPDRAELAGFLHDIFKEESDDVLLKTLGTSDIISDNDLAKKHALWHAFAAAEYAGNVLGIPSDICDAIRYHTSGRDGMTPLDKTLFLADYISEDRKYDDCIKVRKTAATDVNKALIEGLRYTISELLERNAVIDSRTLDAYNSCVRSI